MFGFNFWNSTISPHDIYTNFTSPFTGFALRRRMRKTRHGGKGKKKYNCEVEICELSYYIKMTNKHVFSSTN
jgi:hypothetical protein